MDTSTSLGNRELAVAKKRALDAAYFRKGIAVAALSSCMYALYTAFVAAGQLFGVWAGWFDAFAPSGLLAVFILPTIASGVNDVLSAVWATFFTAGPNLGMRRAPWSELRPCRPSAHRQILRRVFRLLRFCRLLFVYELVSRQLHVRHGAGHGHQRHLYLYSAAVYVDFRRPGLGL